MNLFVWTEALATGNPFIDSEHQELMQRVNAVLESIALQQGDAGLDHCMQQLQSYAIAHFAHEEREMQQVGYASNSAHCAAHATLLAQLQNVHEDLSRGKTGDPMELYRFLTWWVKDHIRDWDVPLAAALAGRS